MRLCPVNDYRFSSNLHSLPAVIVDGRMPFTSYRSPSYRYVVLKLHHRVGNICCRTTTNIKHATRINFNNIRGAGVINNLRATRIDMRIFAVDLLFRD